MVPTRDGRPSKGREVAETKRTSAKAGFTSRAFQEASRRCSCTASSVDEAFILHDGHEVTAAALMRPEASQQPKCWRS